MYALQKKTCRYALKVSKRSPDIFQKRRPGLRRTRLYGIDPFPQQRAFGVTQGSKPSSNYPPSRVAYIAHVPILVPECGHHTKLRRAVERKGRKKKTGRKNRVFLVKNQEGGHEKKKGRNERDFFYCKRYSATNPNTSVRI